MDAIHPACCCRAVFGANAKYPRSRRCAEWLIVGFVFALLLPSVVAQQKQVDLTGLSLEELMNVQVTSAGKKEQRLYRTPAAVYVITAEDIRHSGMTTIPEVLRLAPGVEVAQLSSNAWAISIRGFNAVQSNKLLVLVDGRTVYSPVFSGVLWSLQDLLLEDIDRIEVIRGPGAALWGANAVNGVINIITKSAAETHGALLTAGGGTYERGAAAFRWGARHGQALDYRIYGKYFERDSLGGVAGQYQGEPWYLSNAGFRADWALASPDLLTLEGSAYQGYAGQITNLVVPPSAFISVPPHAGDNGGNLLARWRHAFTGGSDMAWQLYYDGAHRGTFPFGQNESSADLDFQHHLRLPGRNDLVWGGEFRTTAVTTAGGLPFTAGTIASGSRLNLFSVFAQDEIALVSDRMFLTVGSKFEHNEYTGLEVQPSVRLLWLPRPRHALWAAVSRAARTPSIYEDSLRMLMPIPGTSASILSLGNRDLAAESLLAYELGYRLQAAERLSFDVAGFFNRYRDLVGSAPVPSTARARQPLLVYRMVNGLRGATYGGELSATYAPLQIWKLQGSYSLFRGDWSAGPADPATVNWWFTPGQTPRHQFQIRSSFSLLGSVEMDTNLYYVSGLPAYPVPQVTRLDTRLGWKASEHLQFDTVLQNALRPRHIEFFNGNLPAPTEPVKRAVQAKVTFRF